MAIDLRSLPVVAFLARVAGAVPRLSPVVSAVLLCGVLASASPVEMTFTGVNGEAAFGYYVGPYYGTLDGQPVDLFCVDFANDVWIGETWEANLTSINAGADLSQARYGSLPEALSRYQEAAWLTEQYATAPEDQYGDIQATIWSLFNPQISPQPMSASWLQEAQANFTSAVYSDFRIVTNLGPVEANGQVQEFLTRVDSPSTPEAASMLMVGFTLVGFSLWCKRVQHSR